MPLTGRFLFLSLSLPGLEKSALKRQSVRMYVFTIF